jgi:A/G-specific adenine glycosylase
VDLWPQHAARRLEHWGAARGRLPPWRLSRDPYALAAAEILLQKTRGEDVEPVWEALMSAYSVPAKLAEADDEEVRGIVAVLGLGSQRVQRLKRMAQAMHGREHYARLPGLGAYGSAVLALTGGRCPDTPPVDGNIARVICRSLGLSFARGEPRKKPEVKRAVARLLHEQETPAAKLDVVYGLVDLGATVCTPHSPDCSSCPLSDCCAFARSGPVLSSPAIH